MQLRQDRGVDLVGLHPRMRDRLHLKRVGDHHPRDERRQQSHDRRRVFRGFQHDLVIGPQGAAEGHDSVMFQVDPEVFRHRPVREDRDLREAPVNVHSDRSHSSLSQSLSGECSGCATSTDTRSRRTRAGRRGGQITTRARSSKSIRPARVFALQRPCPAAPLYHDRGKNGPLDRSAIDSMPDNNAAERALRGIALGRKSWLFAGSERGGDRAAFMYSLIVTAKMNDIDPQAWLADVLARLPEMTASQVPDLLPWHWRSASSEDRRAA
ncbi:Mobile element protein [Salipiger mucosus DSM 16094]|uniref:Mobile element protein n=1 Tax=Salipiger mucosus DSM 16094 TaxID=1123237 RepID=S9Q9Z7_9RHOB|nr:Mobile element protein [Salipiger mucosus DSM 16094]